VIRRTVVAVHVAVAVEVQPQAPHRVDRHPVFRGPAGVVGIIDVTAFPRDDVARDVANRLHGPPSMLRFAWKKVTTTSLRFD
jgi:hypothetical protein